MRRLLRWINSQKITIPSPRGKLTLPLSLIIVFLCCGLPTCCVMGDFALRDVLGVLPTRTPEPTSTTTLTPSITPVPTHTETPEPSNTLSPSDTPRPDLPPQV
jgi:hypothetical protein